MKKNLIITMCFLLLVEMISCTKEDDSKDEPKGNGRTEEQVNDSISNEKEKELGKETVVKLDNPGMLSNEITPDKKYSITNLKIVGAINGSDISFLRDMAKTEPSGGVMSALDLSDCYIVKGGDCYYEDADTKYYTEDNIIGDNMFSGCDVLKYFTMPPKVSGIGKNAFKKTRITSITIPNTIQIVGECAFENCPLLSIIVDCKEVGPNNWFGKKPEFTFEGDSHTHSYLKEVIFGDSVRIINRSVFDGCRKLTSIYIPKGIIRISEGSFSGCSSLESIRVDKDNSYYDSRNNCNAIIQKAREESDSWGNSIKTGCSLIAGCKNTVIPKDIQVIGREAFYNCKDLKAIDLPDSVRIMSRAFYGCNGITSLIIPPYASVSGDAFIGCQFSKIEFYSDIVESAIFSGMSSIKEVILKGQQYICPSAFENCSGITTIIADEIAICSKAFYGCSNLSSIIINGPVWGVGKEAFYDCINLNSISFHNGFHYGIGEGAFANCELLSSVVFGDSTEYIGKNAFSNCISLTNLVIPNSVNNIGEGTFAGCSGLMNVSLPNSLSKINSYLFRDCTKLTSIIIPENVTTIGSGAFSGCKSLSTITLGEKIDYIQNSFHGCTNLRTIYSYITRPTMNNCPKLSGDNITIYVPNGFVKKYKQTTGWKEYKKIYNFDGGEESYNTNGTILDPYCVADALQVCNDVGEMGTESDVYVIGTITKINEISISNGYATFQISDDALGSNSLIVYHANFINNKPFSSVEEIKTGDIVIICGKLVNDHGDTPLITSGSYIYDISYNSIRYDYYGADNLWKAVDDGTLFNAFGYWFADNGWTQISCSEATHSGNIYEITLPEGMGGSQWQGQFYIDTKLTASAAKLYDFQVVIEADHNCPQVTIKLTDSSDTNFFCESRHNIRGGQPFVYVLRNGTLKEGKDANAIRLFFDFGGSPSGTHIKISKIVFKEAQ